MAEQNEALFKQLYAPTWYQYFAEIPVSKHDLAMMYETDDTISSGVRFLTNTILNLIGEYTNSSAELLDFVQYALNYCANYHEALSDLITDFIVYGIAIAEKVYTREENYILPQKLVRVSPLQVRYDPNEQAYFYQNLKLTPEKFIIVIHGSSPLGKSFLSRLYPYWSAKKMLLNLLVNAMERFAVPPIVVQSDDPETAAEQISNMYSAGIVGITKDSQIEVIKIPQLADDFRKTIEYLNVLIYRSLLLPQLLLTTEFSGTYNLGKVHLQLFEESARGYAKVISNAILEQFVSQILELNFTNIDDYGRFIYTAVLDIETKKALADIIRALTEAGFIDALDDADNDFVRGLFELPKRE